MIQSFNSLNLSFLWFPRNWGIYTFLVFFRKQQGVIFTVLFGLSGKINQCWSDGNNKATPPNNGGDPNVVADQTLSSCNEFLQSNTGIYPDHQNVKTAQTLKSFIRVINTNTVKRMSNQFKHWSFLLLFYMITRRWFHQTKM